MASALAFLPVLSSATDVNMTQYPQAWYESAHNAATPDNARLYDFNYAVLLSTYLGGEVNPSWVYTHAFTKPDPAGYPFGVTYWPADDATIISISVVAVIKTANVSAITVTLGYSADLSSVVFLGKAYHTFTVPPGEGALGPGVLTWNVSAYEAWTPAMFKSAMTWAGIYSTDNTVTTLYVDYIGYLVYWTQPGGGGPGGPPKNDTPPVTPFTPGPEPWNIGFGSINGGLILAIFGVMGIIGMVATPALFWANKDQDGTLAAIAQTVFTFFLFLGLFLAWVYLS